MRQDIFALKELKFAGAQEEMSFDGYASVFGNQDAHGDVIKKGAFKRTLADARKGEIDWPAMLLQHGGILPGSDDLTPIGVWTEFAEDDTGLHVAGKLADTTRGREVYTLLKMKPRPALDGLSIGYGAKKWEQGTRPGDPRRILTEVDLFEVSIVTMPANSQARIEEVKSGKFRKRHAERALRDAGFSVSEAQGILTKGFDDAIIVRDADEVDPATEAALKKLLTSIKGASNHAR